MNLEHEEAKEKESCEKSASEESRLEMSNSLWQSYTMASKPKFLEDPQYIRSASQFANASLFSHDIGPEEGISEDSDDASKSPGGFAELKRFTKSVGLKD